MIRKEMVNILLLLLLTLTVLLAGMSVIDHYYATRVSSQEETWEVITDGKNFTYKSGGYINSETYSTAKEAEIEMLKHKHLYEHDMAQLKERKQWKTVEERQR